MPTNNTRNAAERRRDHRAVIDAMESLDLTLADLADEDDRDVVTDCLDELTTSAAARRRLAPDTIAALAADLAAIDAAMTTLIDAHDRIHRITAAYLELNDSSAREVI